MFYIILLLTVFFLSFLPDIVYCTTSLVSFDKVRSADIIIKSFLLLISVTVGEKGGSNRMELASSDQQESEEVEMDQEVRKLNHFLQSGHRSIFIREEPITKL